MADMEGPYYTSLEAITKGKIFKKKKKHYYWTSTVGAQSMSSTRAA